MGHESIALVLVVRLEAPYLEPSIGLSVLTDINETLVSAFKKADGKRGHRVSHGVIKV